MGSGGLPNPEWEKNWQAGVASAVSEVGDYQNKLPQGFKDRLNNVKKPSPLRLNSIKFKYARKKQETTYYGWTII